MEALELYGNIDVRALGFHWSEPCDIRPAWNKRSHAFDQIELRYSRASEKAEIEEFRYFPKPEIEAIDGDTARLAQATGKKVSLRAAAELASAILQEAEARRAQYAEEEAARSLRALQIEP